MKTEMLIKALLASLLMICSSVQTIAQQAETAASQSEAALSPSEASIRRAQINKPVVGIMGAGLNGTMTRLLADVAEVTSEDDPSNPVRVVPILGGGSITNVSDLLYMAGVDGAFIQADVLQFYNKLQLETNLGNKIRILAPFGRQMAHIIAPKATKTIFELEGRKVNFGRQSSGTAISALTIFENLEITVDVSNMSHRKALAALRKGEIDAMFWMTSPPAGLLEDVNVADDLHLLEIPIEAAAGDDSYEVRAIPASLYEGLASESINTLSVQTLLAVYNWSSSHERYGKVKRFQTRLEKTFSQLKEDPYHEAFRDMDLEEAIPSSWTRFE